MDIFTTQLARVVQIPIKPANLKVKALLKELNLDTNTLIMFTSDNGPSAEGGADMKFFDSNGKFRGYKRDLYEGGIRMPTLAYWPGKVAAGQKFVSPEIAQLIAISKLDMNNNNPFEQLSDRELEITLMLVHGQRVPEIASSLNISAKTVNTYRYRLFDKLNINTDVELTHLALRYKLILSEVM